MTKKSPKRLRRWDAEIRCCQGVLNSLLAPKYITDGRIDKKKLAESLQYVNADHAVRSLDRYLTGEFRPKPEEAFVLGEKLRELGVPWCSGVWMLWVCGYFKDVFAILVIWLRNVESFSESDPDLIWHMFVLAAPLARTTPLDAIAPFAFHHVRKGGMDHDILDAAAKWLLRELNQGSGVAAVETFDTFVHREIIKFVWSHYGRFRTQFQSAFDQWCADKRRFEVRTSLDRIAAAAMAVSDAYAIPIDSREQTVLTLLGHWLTCLERGVQINLYSRTINPDFSRSRLVPEISWREDREGNLYGDVYARQLVEMFTAHPDWLAPIKDETD